MRTLLAAFLATLVFVSACERMTEAENEAAIARMWPRPADVPESAILHAGEDGGHWADCRFENNDLWCDIYNVRGGLDYRQAFKVCVNAQPGTLANGVMGTEDRAYPVGRQKLFLVPSSPSQLAGDQPELQEKVDQEFADLQPSECAVQLAPIQPD